MFFTAVYQLMRLP